MLASVLKAYLIDNAGYNWDSVALWNAFSNKISTTSQFYLISCSIRLPIRRKKSGLADVRSHAEFKYTRAYVCMLIVHAQHINDGQLHNNIYRLLQERINQIRACNSRSRVWCGRNPWVVAKNN